MRRTFDEQVVRRVLENHQFHDDSVCRCGRPIRTYALMVSHQMAAMKVADLESSRQLGTG